MKKIHAMMLALLSLCAACSKSGTKTPTSPTSTKYSMTASISGVPFSYDNCVLTYDNLPDSTRRGIKTGSATPHIDLFFHPYTGVGVYTCSGTGTDGEAYLTTDSTDEIASSGTITITSVDPNITGTFSFTTSHGHTISNGSFTAKRN